MACALTQGYALDCRNSVGGVKEVYITELANKNQLVASSGTISTFTLSTGKKFWTYELEKQTADYQESIQTSDVNGTLYYEQDLTLPIRKMSASLRNEINLLAQNRLMIIVLDRNGVYWLLGQTNGCELQPSTAKTGKAMNDFNGYELKFKGMEENAAQVVSASLITALTTPAV